MAGSRRARGAGGVSSPWIVVSVGVLVMVVLMAVALGAVSGSRPVADPGPPLPTVPLPVLPSPSLGVRKGGTPPATTPARSPSPSESPSVTPTVTRSVTPSPSASDRPRTTVGTPGAPAGPATTATTTAVVVAGAYRLVDDYHDAFIGEVRVTNVSDRPQDWTVRVAVPGSRLVAVWVEGGARPGVSGSRGRYTFTSGADLAPGASAALRFHVDGTGRATRPEECTVDGATCAGL
ncbi:cellulose binding domain-containing protein [Micromonospora cathayae]|uniref:Cellulose binding domain-containing protein n=1 Tax=Micromonospora cathayae TaxID=3028804 RepID=A0ABY7ZMC2_9ACTN|nr:cellulose binding domain-containing protein [Micromonospora sp. HUAS 3]WDZ84155.1 cellulose binding domain-containing protein [Micromonospora sp. HUAS 3]